jgi:hypothetical protein
VHSRAGAPLVLAWPLSSDVYAWGGFALGRCHRHGPAPVVNGEYGAPATADDRPV